ncbi:SixA phosphatase family protein [Maribacter sp. 2304DJ31-5]|uniref:SixA phosphatase family protein n=1 Tax=Maribacter sp. 2304DJ31-5 TaxID=3386273 RepID=UPI0039BC71C4
MKNLVLMRHGKSSWEYDVSDQDRPLLQRGMNDAHLVSSEFAGKGISIDFAFSSPANRALHTATICLRILRYPWGKFKVTPELYDFSGNQVLDFIKGSDDNLQTILIFGHNHAFTHIANTLGDKYIENVPTSGLVSITFQTNSWRSIHQGKTEQIIFPKQLKG